MCDTEAMRWLNINSEQTRVKPKIKYKMVDREWKTFSLVLWKWKKGGFILVLSLLQIRTMYQESTFLIYQESGMRTKIDLGKWLYFFLEKLEKRHINKKKQTGILFLLMKTNWEMKTRKKHFVKVRVMKINPVVTGRSSGLCFC